MSKIEIKLEDELSSQIGPANNNIATSSTLNTSSSNKITLDQIASTLLKQNFILTALELHTELAENGKELPRLRDYFSNPANFEQQQQLQPTPNSNLGGSLNSGGFFPLHKASSIQTFDSLDLTRYSDDVDQNKFQDDKIAVLEFELRKAKETINQLRTTLTLATENQSSNMSKSSLNGQSLDQSDKPSLEHSNSNNNSKTNLININLNKNVNFNLNLNDAEYEEEEYDLIEKNLFNNNVQVKTNANNGSNSNKIIKNQNNNCLMPHDKNAINFLINEYLLDNNYKMTSVTFSEENESQDLEDWDVVGLNRSKPPNLFQLYKLYLNKSKSLDGNKRDSNSEKKLSKSPSENRTEIGVQVEIELTTTSTNTNVIEMKHFESLVNFDRETFETQRMQINKLLEKQEILLKSLSKLESEINSLNSERENYLKKIDLLTVSLDKANSTIKTMSETEQIKIKEENRLSKENSIEIEEKIEPINENEPNKDDKVDEKVDQEIYERKIPVVFKEILNKYTIVSYSEMYEAIIEKMSNLKLENQQLINMLYKCLPIITPYVSIEKRLELLPIILIGAILEQEDISKSNTKQESGLIKLMFNIIDRPNSEQRSLILAACIQYTKYVEPIFVNNFLLSQCWEQLDDKTDERRILVAEACASLAPYIYNDIRSSLMFSILKHLIEQETSESVKVCAVKSLSILINHIKDEQKFIQCIELLDLCATDPSSLAVEQVEKILMPSLSLWALTINKLSDTLIMHLIEKADYHIVNNRQKYKRNENETFLIDHEKHAITYMNLLNLNLQFIFGFILIHFRISNKIDTENDLDTEINDGKKLPKLNSYFYSLQEKLDFKLDLYKLDSILEDYLHLTTKYLNLIETDLWSSIELSNAFTWLSDTFIRKLIQMSAQVDAKDSLCMYFVQLFRNFTLLFAIDFELIKSKIIPIFEKLLNIPDFETDSSQQTVIEQVLCNKTCPLFKSTLPVYFVGILSTLVDVEIYGWFNLNSDLLKEQDCESTFKTESSPSSISSEKVISSSASKLKNTSKNRKQTNGDNMSNKSMTPLEKRIDHMTNYLKNVFFALSLNQTNLDGIISIYELMKLKAKSSDYVIQMLLSTLWDGIVHISLYVRCNTAKLFEILVKDCDEYLLSTRILPALITLANDLDKMVRCSSISPLTSIIENCSNKEILERVYTQLQSFLSDPILKDDYLLQIELLKTFKRISTKVNAKFREEFILPYLTILTMNVKNVINDNDYEFSLTAFTASFLALSTLSPTTLSASSSSSSLSSYSSKDNNFQLQQGQQQDLIKICVLLFNTYQKLCLTSDENQKPIYISRQSIQESLLPGLSCLRDIFHNNITINTTSLSAGSLSNTKNEYVLTIDNMIHKIEQMQNSSADLNGSPNLNRSSNSNATHMTPSPSVLTTNTNENTNSISPLKVSPGNLVGDLLNAGANALSSSSSSSLSSTNNFSTNNQNGVNMENNNFKSFVFKGITNLNHSKDKLSSFLLTNKTFKK